MNREQDNSEQISERLVSAYDAMLRRAQQSLDTAATRTEIALNQALDLARDRAVELGEVTREEADRVHAFVTRDVYDIGQQLATEEREITDWLRLGALVVEKGLVQRISRLAQAAKLELRHMEKARRRLSEWHTGEVTTIGTLRCRHCGALLHFERIGRIPPCPKCHATSFERTRRHAT